ncbi:DUF29 family protein [Altericista sp. CCNU0014]
MKQKSVLEQAYAIARKNATSETGLPLIVFPEICPFSIEPVLAEEF